MNERLMRHRREYISLKDELENVVNKITEEMDTLHLWTTAMSELKGNLESYPTRCHTPFLQIQNHIMRLRVIEESYLKAIDIRKKMEKLRVFEELEA